MDIDNLFASLDQNTLILTANERLAASLRRYYNEQQLKLHRHCWENKNILSLQTWLRHTLQSDLSNQHIVLNDYQEFTLWKSIICDEQNFYWPTQLSHLIKQIQTAWTLLNEWRIPLEQLRDYPQNNVHIFYTWAKKFTQQCKNRDWIDRTALIPLLIQSIHQNTIKLPKKILLSGFLQPSPQINLLFNSLQHNCELSNLDLYQTPQNIHKLSLPNEDEEITAAAHWAKQLLESSAESKIACIIPHLDEIREKVQKIFTQVFSPKKFHSSVSEVSVFNISGGKKLSENAIIKCALTLLHLDAEEVDIHIISYLLNSPFLSASETEFDGRALLDLELRQLNEVILSLRFVMAHAKTEKRAPILAKIIFKWLRLIKRRPAQASMNEWRRYFTELLRELGWPGQRTLNSLEYQVVNRFMELLRELCCADLIQEEIPYDQALLYLQHYCENISFQAETHQTSLQILGKLEAVGLNFDYLWVMGLDNERFPANPRLNPWLPAALQQQLQLPHASAEAELQFCKILLQRYLASAKSVFLSYAAGKKDQECLPSSLIEKFPEQDSKPYWSFHENLLGASTLQQQYHYFTDSKSSILKAEETTRGGSYLLKDQSLCPFRAFAKFRLRAQPFPAPQSGLNAQERGNLVHETLMRFWQHVRDHQTLCQKSEPELQEIISQSIDDSFVGLIKMRPYTFKKRYMSIEKKRLFALLKKWLEIEKTRPSFTVIAQEQQRECQIRNLKLLLRIDRIDQLSDGHQLVIDYKTGNTTINDWLGERPKDPQLPLYCISSTTAIQGLLFAQIRPQDMGFKGLAAEELKIDGVIPSSQLNDYPWLKLLQEWRENLEKLADDYYHGHAAVDPKEGLVTCEYCEFPALCRINESELPHDES